MFLPSTVTVVKRRSYVTLGRLSAAWSPVRNSRGGRLAAATESLAHPGKRAMGTTIVEGVDFDTIAREWRCKWSAENDKQSLAELQKILNEAKAEIKAVKGVKSVQRVVCGGCLDFKVVVALEDSKFGEWEESGFAPEESFLEKIKKIDGVSVVETQTYTLMPVEF